jgi:phosphoserine phosphatase RsbU/P
LESTPTSETPSSGALLEMAFVPTLEAIRSVRKAITHALQKTSLTESVRQDLLLVLSEWLANLQEHARETPKGVTLLVSWVNDQLAVDVSDDGSSFNEYRDRRKDLTEAPYEVELHEGGLGLRLIAHLFPDHTYETKTETVDGRNHFKLYYPPNSSRRAQPRVVIIDDDESIRRLIEVYLRESYDVKAFADAESALQYIGTEPIDLVISDIKMPGMDGMTLRRRLADRNDTDVLPFIFLTSSEDQSTQEEAADLGVDDYLSKPITKARLLTVVKRLLKRARDLREKVGLHLEARVTASLAPQLPEQIGGFRSIVRTLAASAGGGDFIVHRTSPQGETLILGDVMGHGLQAKFFAHAHVGYLQGLIKTLPANVGPAGTLQELSKAIGNDALLENSIVTCLALIFEPNGRVRVANAGHPAPLIVQNSAVRELAVGGPLLGMPNDAGYEEKSLEAVHGGRILLYTDGLSEIGVGRDDRGKGLAAVSQLLQETAALPIHVAANHILADYKNRINGMPADDMTFVLIEWAGHG